MSANAAGWTVLTQLVEPIAAVAGLVYVLLIMWRNRWGWVASALSSIIYVMLMAQARLPMQAALNGYYVAMALYGWFSWTRNANAEGGRLFRWSWRQHLAAAAAIVTLGLVGARWLASETQAAWPLLDSLVTVTCLLAGFMVARSVLENWLYWIAADSVSVFMFMQQHLLYTAALYTAYLVIAVVGMRAWLRRYRQQQVG